MIPPHDIPNLPDGMDAGNLVDCHVGCGVIHQIPTKIEFRHRDDPRGKYLRSGINFEEIG
jgi:hypothetical protein